VCPHTLAPVMFVSLLLALLLCSGENSTYDNPGMRRTPHAAVKGKGDMDPEEDIYGGFGEREGGIYDLTTGGGRGMKHSEEGIYDNPHAKGKWRDSYKHPYSCSGIVWSSRHTVEPLYKGHSEYSTPL